MNADSEGKFCQIISRQPYPAGKGWGAKVQASAIIEPQRVVGGRVVQRSKQRAIIVTAEGSSEEEALERATKAAVDEARRLVARYGRHNH